MATTWRLRREADRSLTDVYYQANFALEGSFRPDGLVVG